MIQRRLFTALFILAATASGVKAQMNLPTIAATGGALVLARTVEITDAPNGTTVENGVAKDQAWKFVVLERIDAFIGAVPQRCKVAVLAQDIATSDFFSGKPTTSGGYSGPGPVAGLQVGDVAVWSLQRPDSAGFFSLRYNSTVTPSLAQAFTAPGADFMLFDLTGENWAIQGAEPTGRKRMAIPNYDKKLSGPLRYADLVACMAMGYPSSKEAHRVGSATEADFNPYARRLQMLTDSFAAPEDAPPIVTNEILRQWFNDRVVQRWPTKKEVDRMNLDAIRLSWGEEEVEQDFCKLYLTYGFKNLSVELPPVQDKNFYIELCGSDNPSDAAAGFSYLRHTKTQDPRVLASADRWLEIGLRPKGDPLADNVRGMGVLGSIFWYLADAYNDRSLSENWSHPSPSDIARERDAIKKLRK